MRKEVFIMPGGDGTGPQGMGPMTGRAMGYCAGYTVPGSMNPRGFGSWGRGRGTFFGRGRGFRNMYYATGMPGWMRYGYPPYGINPITPQYTNPQYTKDDEIQFLKNQADYFKKALDDISSRLSELEKEE
jgi:hypothetical protein